MNTKPFSQDLYNKNDDAKQIIIDHLKSLGFEAFVNPDDYGIDIVYHKDSMQKKYCEVEVKHNWKGSKFPFNTVHLPGRKLKFAKEDSLFAMLNHERTHVMIIPGALVSQSKIVVKDTIYTKAEEFIEVDITDCKIVKLKEDR